MKLVMIACFWGEIFIFSMTDIWLNPCPDLRFMTAIQTINMDYKEQKTSEVIEPSK